MQFKSHLETERGLKNIVIAPLIGVVLLLMLFFLLISNFVTPQGVRVNLPKAFTSEATGRNNLEIIISEKNEVLFDNRVITPDELKTLLKQVSRSSATAVLIKADKQVVLGKVIEIWNICKDAGVKQLNLVSK